MLELYTDRKKILYCLQVCETFQALSAEIEGKGNSPVHSSKKHADLERVGRKKSSLDNCTQGVRFGYKTCQNGQRAGFMLIGSPIQCSREGMTMYSRGRNVS